MDVPLLLLAHIVRCLDPQVGLAFADRRYVGRGHAVLEAAVLGRPSALFGELLVVMGRAQTTRVTSAMAAGITDRL